MGASCVSLSTTDLGRRRARHAPDPTRRYKTTIRPSSDHRYRKAPWVLGDDRARVRYDYEGAGPFAKVVNCPAPSEHRRFRATFSAAGSRDARVDHRWLGAPNLCSRTGGSGLSTLIDPRLRPDDVFLGDRDAPDAVVVASGNHDLHLGKWDGKVPGRLLGGPPRSPAEYGRAANKTVDRLAAWGVPAGKVVWLSNNALGRCNDGGILEAYDAAAKDVARSRGATFVDISESLNRHFAQPFLTACCGDDLGIHHGAIIRFQHPEKSQVASALEVQHLLGGLCPLLGAA